MKRDLVLRRFLRALNVDDSNSSNSNNGNNSNNNNPNEEEEDLDLELTVGLPVGMSLPLCSSPKIKAQPHSLTARFAENHSYSPLCCSKSKAVIALVSSAATLDLLLPTNPSAGLSLPPTTSNL